MRGEFLQYLESIGMTKTLRKRVETIYEFYEGVCSDEITDIFVTDYLSEDGTREYENLWFFSPTYCMEAKLFITKDDFDIAPIRRRMVYSSIEKQDYDFKKSTEKSRLHLNFRLDNQISGNLKASKENCEHLKHIFFNYVVPNLKE